ncbi:MAG: hypothetical protein FWG25_05195 [Promicromonosporaceae bacterium]|nr:hypothetical protein [Promicromonosporaceae bacterium]
MGLAASEVLSSTELDALLGEQLMPITQGDGNVAPSLVALDAGGATVAVQILERLDHATLVRSLGLAGALGRMSRGELAALYPGGPKSFQSDLSSYLVNVPYRRTMGPARGARLVIICGEAEPEMYNAIDFLSRPELPIKLFRARFIQATDGTRFLDLTPLSIAPSSPPGQPRLSGTGTSRFSVERTPPEVSLPSPVPISWGTRRSVRPITGSQESLSGIPVDLPSSRAAITGSQPPTSAAPAPETPASPTIESTPADSESVPVVTPPLESRVARRKRLAAERAAQSSAAVAPADNPAPPYSLTVPLAPSSPTPVSTPVATAEPLTNPVPQSGAQTSGPAAAPSSSSLSESMPQRVTQAMPLPTRRSLRNRLAGLAAEPKEVTQPTGKPDGLTDSAVLRLADGTEIPADLEITGVFSLGSEATDPHSWNTTSLPVVARPRTFD